MDWISRLRQKVRPQLVIAGAVVQGSVRGISRILLVAAIAMVAADIIAYWKIIVEAADKNEGFAAWIQAAGVFIAVLLASLFSRQDARRSERRTKDQQLQSMASLVNMALGAAYDIDRAITRQSLERGERDPLEVLIAVHDAMTPMRLHSLPNAHMLETMVALKADITTLVTKLAEQRRKWGEIGMFTEAQEISLLHALSRVMLECKRFLNYAKVKKLHGPLVLG